MTTAPTSHNVLLSFGPRATVQRDVYLFLLLACVFTWSVDIPMALAAMRRTQPSEAAMSLGGLGALGPTLVALALSSLRGQRRAVFGQWRTDPHWLLVALLTVPAAHLVATTIEVLLGGHPAQWFYPPVRPEHFMALVFFSIGEEFGWRGYAYPRLTQVNGPVIANVVLGTTWALWHLGMMCTAEGPPTVATVLIWVIELVCSSFVIAWLFEKSNRSILVAILVHMGAHLDNVSRAPESEVRLRVLRVVVFAIAAIFAGRSLHARHSQSTNAAA